MFELMLLDFKFYSPMVFFIHFTYFKFKNKYLNSTSEFPQLMFTAQVFQLYL